MKTLDAILGAIEFFCKWVMALIVVCFSLLLASLISWYLIQLIGYVLEVFGAVLS